MRKLRTSEKNIRTTLEGVATACNCNAICRWGGAPSFHLKELQYRGAIVEGPVPTKLNTDI